MMNPFADLLKDVVFVVNKAGNRQGPYKTNLSTGKATIFDRNLNVSVGDVLVNPLSEGKEKIFKITEIRKTEGMMDIPESQILYLDKNFTISSPEQKTTPQINNGADKNGKTEKTLLKVIKYLLDKVEASDESEEAKIIAKLKIKELVSNPIISNIIGKDAKKLLN